jgi:glyoxylase-like metal-dependent hydrolase (beta-lactamase superfamily II)
MAPGVYNVGGNTWMASYLIDTGAGLVLIDTELQECLYLILENIRSLGFDPKDITDIFVTHAHIDHIGGVAALKALTGAKIWLGKRDLHFLNNTNLVGAALGYKCNYVPFEPDCFYDDSKPIKIGNITFETMNTAGHTPGTTSFFFDVTDKNGKKLRCGLHGGIGNNTFSDEYFKKTGEDPALMAEARRLAEGWLNDRKGVDPDMLGSVLGTAAKKGDRALFDRMLGELKKVEDRSQRRMLIAALGSFDDPKIIVHGDTAVVTTGATVKGTLNGVPQNGTSVVTIVFAQTQDGLKVIHGHPSAPATSAPAGANANAARSSNAVANANAANR